MARRHKSTDGTARMKIRDSAFDLRKKGIKRFDLRDPYHLAVTLSWPAFIIAFLGVLGALNGIFAFLYASIPGAVQNLAAGDLLHGFFFSFETLSTVGYGEYTPASDYGHWIVTAEIVLGMSFTAIFTGLLFVRFSKPQARILFPDRAVVTLRNGTSTLMVRIANGRLTMLTHATAKLTMFVLEITDEGHAFRRVIDPRLERDELPIFPLTWTLMHVIDESSPITGLTAEDLKEREARFFITVEARDVTLGSLVQDIGALQHDQVVFNRRYAEAVSIDEAGRTIADLSRLSLLE